MDIAARELGIILDWQGHDLAEKATVAQVDPGRLSGICPEGIDVCLAVKPGDCLVEIDPRYFRPAEVDSLLGNAAQAHSDLGWAPAISFEEMVEEMVRHDVREAARDHLCLASGFTVCDSRE